MLCSYKASRPPPHLLSFRTRRLFRSLSERTAPASGRWQSCLGGACFSLDRKSTRLNSSHLVISYAVFCLKKRPEFPTGSKRCARPPMGRDDLGRICRAVNKPVVAFFFLNGRNPPDFIPSPAHAAAVI